MICTKFNDKFLLDIIYKLLVLITTQFDLYTSETNATLRVSCFYILISMTALMLTLVNASYLKHNQLLICKLGKYRTHRHNLDS